MKAIVRVISNEKVLGVNLPTEKAEIIRKLLQNEGIQYISAKPNCGGEQVGYIFGLDGFSGCDDNNEQVDGEILLFCGLSGKKLNHIIAKIKSNNAAVELNAVVTPTNKNWKLSQLAREITKEHEIMHNLKDGVKNDGKKI